MVTKIGQWSTRPHPGLRFYRRRGRTGVEKAIYLGHTFMKFIILTISILTIFYTILDIIHVHSYTYTKANSVSKLITIGWNNTE